MFRLSVTRFSVANVCNTILKCAHDAVFVVSGLKINLLKGLKIGPTIAFEIQYNLWIKITN